MMDSSDQPATRDGVLASSAIVMPDQGQVEVVAGEVDPGDLGPEEVVVGAKYSVISPGTELAHYRGDAANGVLAHAGRRGYPFYPGYAMSGVVLAAGPDTGLQPGQRVLSHTPHASVARLDRFRRDVARRSGIEWVGDPDEAREYLGKGGRARVVIECSGRSAGVVLAVDLCGPHGEVFTVGAPWTADPEVPASAVLAPVLKKYLNLRSGWEWQVPRYGDGYGRSIVGCTTWILQQLAAGTVTTEPLVTDVVPPSGAAEAYRRLANEPDHAVTFLIDWSTHA